MLVPNLADLHITDFDGKHTLTLYVIHLALSAPERLAFLTCQLI